MSGPDLRRLPTDRWPQAWRDEFEERAALVEDGCPGLSRRDAEARAREMVIQQWKREQGEGGQ